MDINVIAQLIEAGISVIAFIISIVAVKKGASTKTIKTIEEIAQDAKNVADKYFEKQCKKNKIDTNQKK